MPPSPPPPLPQALAAIPSTAASPLPIDRHRATSWNIAAPPLTPPPARANTGGVTGALDIAVEYAEAIDTCAVVGAFSVVDRIAVATGISLDAGMAAMSGEVRKELDLARFAASANSPGL
jgi:hypothetical protein